MQLSCNGLVEEEKTEKKRDDPQSDVKTRNVNILRKIIIIIKLIYRYKQKAGCCLHEVPMSRNEKKKNVK